MVFIFDNVLEILHCVRCRKFLKDGAFVKKRRLKNYEKTVLCKECHCPTIHMEHKAISFLFSILIPLAERQIHEEAEFNQKVEIHGPPADDGRRPRFNPQIVFPQERMAFFNYYALKIEEVGALKVQGPR